ncbi:hypothetical protein OK016_07935 [Vibrio chagasii]|nr:hypothetical protein [Vibrio chagasii]
MLESFPYGWDIPVFSWFLAYGVYLPFSWRCGLKTKAAFLVGTLGSVLIGVGLAGLASCVANFVITPRIYKSWSI